MKPIDLRDNRYASTDGKVRSAVDLVTRLETRFPEIVGTPATTDAALRYQQGVRTVILAAKELVYGSGSK